MPSLGNKLILAFIEEIISGGHNEVSLLESVCVGGGEGDEGFHFTATRLTFLAVQVRILLICDIPSQE